MLSFFLSSPTPGPCRSSGGARQSQCQAQRQREGPDPDVFPGGPSGSASGVGPAVACDSSMVPEEDAPERAGAGGTGRCA